MRLLLSIFTVSLLTSLPAHALFELRGGYGLSQPKVDFVAGTAIEKVDGFHADLLIEPPLTSFGFGLRYEMLGFDINGPTWNSNASLDRLSVLVNYRIIDFFFFLGVIGSVGVMNDMTVDNYGGGNSEAFGRDFNFSYGVEGGLSFGLFQVGLELGYFQGGDFTPENAALVLATPLNIDGFYAKLGVGVGF